MTTEHDFQNAAEWFGVARNENLSYENLPFEVSDAIRFALRLADKLLKQEPSFEMKQAGSQKVGSDYEVRGTFGIAEDTFKSMLTTAVKEIENGN